MVQIGARVPRPYRVLREQGLDIPKEAFRLWWTMMSDAIFERLLQGEVVLAGGQLRGFLFRSSYGSGLKRIVRLKHLKSKSVVFYKWFILSRDKDHKKSYSLRLKNELEADRSLFNRLDSYSNSRRLQDCSHACRKVDSFIKEICRKASKETGIKMKTWLRAHILWSRYVAHEAQKRERASLRWYCITATSTSGDSGIASQSALREWRDTTGEKISWGIAKLIEITYRKIIVEYRSIKEKPYNTSSDAKFLSQVSTFDGAVELVRKRIMERKKWETIPLDCAKYIVRALAAKQAGGAVLPYRIQLGEIPEHLGKIDSVIHNNS